MLFNNLRKENYFIEKDFVELKKFSGRNYKSF